MSKNLTLSKALRAEGYNLVNALRRISRIPGRVRFRLVIGRHDSVPPISAPLTDIEHDDIDAIVKEFFPEAELWWADSQLQIYTIDVPKGTRHFIGTPSKTLRRRYKQRRELWRRRVISAARSQFDEDE